MYFSKSDAYAHIQCTVQTSSIGWTYNNPFSYTYNILFCHLGSTPSLAAKYGIKSLVKNSVGHVLLTCPFKYPIATWMSASFTPATSFLIPGAIDLIRESIYSTVIV